MNKKNLLIVTSTFPRWKNDTDPPFVYELARRLTDSFHVTVLTPNYPGALQKENIDGIQVFRFRYFLKKYEILAGSEGILPTLKKNKLFYFVVPFFILGELFALLKLIRKAKPHVIHAHWILPQGLVAALASKITRVPYIITVHGSDIFGLKGRFSNILKSYVLQNALRVTAVSKDIQQTIRKKFGKNISTEVVSMGVDSQLFHPDRKDLSIRQKYNITGPFLLYVGRLSEVKGVRYLIEAMPRVLKKIPDCKLLIIGGGELELELIHMANYMNLDDRVIFAGAIPNKEIPQYLATADVFIGPSIQTKEGGKEGFGLTFVEAGMSGCIVVSSNVGGMAGIIENEKIGFIAKEKDSESLAEILCHILEQIDKLSDMRTIVRKKMISSFDWQVIADKYTQILSS